MWHHCGSVDSRIVGIAATAERCIQDALAFRVVLVVLEGEGQVEILVCLEVAERALRDNSLVCWKEEVGRPLDIKGRSRPSGKVVQFLAVCTWHSNLLKERLFNAIQRLILES